MGGKALKEFATAVNDCGGTQNVESRWASRAGREGQKGQRFHQALSLGGGLLCMQRHCYLGSGANLPWCGTLCVDASAVPRHLKESLTSQKRLGEAKARSMF